MDTVDVNLQERAVGKAAAKSLKSQGMIPCILYGNDGSIPVAVEEDAIRNLIGKLGENALLNVNFKGNTVSVKIQDVQRDPIHYEEIKHIDLMPVDMAADENPPVLH